jgi:hypothetical protein
MLHVGCTATSASEANTAEAQPAHSDRRAPADAPDDLGAVERSLPGAPKALDEPESLAPTPDYDQLPDTPSGIYSSTLASFDTVTHIPLAKPVRDGLDVRNHPIHGRSTLRFGSPLSDNQRQEISRFLVGARHVSTHHWSDRRRLVIRYTSSAGRATFVGMGASRMLVTGRLRPRGYLPAMLSERLCARVSATLPTAETRRAARWACHGDLTEVERLLVDEDRSPTARDAVDTLRVYTFDGTSSATGSPGAARNAVAQMTLALFEGRPSRALGLVTPDTRRRCQREPTTACQLTRSLATGAWEQVLVAQLDDASRTPQLAVQLQLEHGWAMPPDLAEHLLLEHSAALERGGAHALAIDNYKTLLARESPGSEERILARLETGYAEGGDTFRARAVADYRREQGGGTR